MIQACPPFRAKRPTPELRGYLHNLMRVLRELKVSEGLRANIGMQLEGEFKA